ncbi:MAG TPA: undecaprenyldiphospho-muramoylpentapeptide beta-N-acetylglucosaminyltransferase [Candidatus Acidoferrales bacterium]|nr:undecaprenyldiphospho-muramoylpentapeptide beta-N-acetylglucosaminyltransferase [Candidatus Acidoferrales bacterium]
MKLLVAGGGTGGHVFPALAVAKEWLARDPGREAVFVGTARGLENKLVPPTGIPLELIRSAGLKGIGGKKLFENLSLLPKAFSDSFAILNKYRFNVAFGVGGYAAGPIIFAAWLKRIPVVIFEPNAEPGFANRVLARFAARIATGYDALAQRFGRKAIATGSPVREEFQFAPMRRVGTPFHLLITGGSQGARALNRAIVCALPLLAERKQDFEIVHQTGERDFEEVRTAYAQHEFTAQVKPFIQDMPQRLAWADLAVCRAGQITVAELAAVGRPAIFIPFAAAADNHQLRNAQALERAGAARIVLEGEATGERLAWEICEAVARPDRLADEAKRAHEFARPHATRDIVNLIEQVARP